MKLADTKCQPCKGIGKTLTQEEARSFLAQLAGWDINKQATVLTRILVMKNFMTAIKLINQIAEIAESENHHPDLHLTNYRCLQIDLCTHELEGLTQNDFIVAAKINKLPLELKASG